MAALTMGDLHNYVVQDDANTYKNVPQGFVKLLVTHSNLKQKWPEIKVNLHTTVSELKDKLYNHGGTIISFQKLILRDTLGNKIADLSDGAKKLGFFGIENGMNVHIVDEDPHSLSRNGGLEDVTLVKKYVMPDEEYGKLEGSLRNYKKKQREKDPNWTFLKENRREPKDVKEYPLESVKDFKVGDRCEVMPGKRRAEIKWIGESESDIMGSGFWIGVQFDEPLGKSDGSVKEVRYFECEPKFGGFVRPDKLTVGDFPERDLEEECSSSDEEIPA